MIKILEKILKNLDTRKKNVVLYKKQFCCRYQKKKFKSKNLKTKSKKFKFKRRGIKSKEP